MSGPFLISIAQPLAIERDKQRAADARRALEAKAGKPRERGEGVRGRARQGGARGCAAGAQRGGAGEGAAHLPSYDQSGGGEGWGAAHLPSWLQRLGLSTRKEPK